MVVADVSGHGIAPALVMTAFRALLRTYARSRSGTAQTARQINQVLPEFTGSSHFVTMVYAVLELDQGRLTYTNCGHPTPLILRSNGSLEQKSTSCPALGIIQNATFTSEEINLAPGDVLLCLPMGLLSSPIQTDTILECSD